jgi:hypothetical protein
VVKIIPAGPIPVINRFKAINWLAPAKTAADNKKHSIRVIEHPFANIPKAIAAGTYPIKIGIPAFTASFTSPFIIFCSFF